MNGNWVDALVLGVFFWFTGSGIWMGLTRSLFRLLSIVLGGIAAWFYSPYLSPLIQDIFQIQSPWLVRVISGCIVFLTAMGLTLLVGKIVQKVIKASPLSLWDRIGGGGLGIAKAMCINLFLLSILGLLPSSAPFWDWKRDSNSYQIYIQSDAIKLRQTIKNRLFEGTSLTSQISQIPAAYLKQKTKL